MDRLYKPTDAMRAARKRAMERFKALSYQELLSLSEANLHSTTVEFLDTCENSECVTGESHILSDEYIIARPRYVSQTFTSTAAAFYAAAVTSSSRFCGTTPFLSAFKVNDECEALAAA